MFETKKGTIKPIVYVGIIKEDRLLLVDYKEAPNPAKSGWWIPAPGLDFGEDPEEKAKSVAIELGLTDDEPKLFGVESFVLPGGWHMIYHYIIKTDTEPKANANIKQLKWVSTNELGEMKDMAHGKWEIGVGKRYLGN